MMMAIHTATGEPVEVIGPPMLSLLDPTTIDDPVVKVRSIEDPSWVRDIRVSRLRADGGMGEIVSAIEKAKGG